MSRKGMSRGAKISIIMVIILLLLAGAVVGGVILLGNKSAELPDIERTERLAAPQNLAISEDWQLSFDAVDGAIGYYVLIDGQKNVTTKETVVDVSSFATVGNHSFAVRALHSLSSFHSNYSSSVERAKYMTLDTPGDTSLSSSLSSLLFSWGHVSEAKSYVLCLTDDLSNKTYLYSSYATEFDLANYLLENPNLQWFDVQVMASAEDRVTGVRNSYILDSAYSDSLRYYRPSSISASVITANFDEVTYVGTGRAISWVIQNEESDISSEYVDSFEVWFDGRKIKTVEKSEFAALRNYVFDMSIFPTTDTVGDHEIYILSVPQEDVGSNSLRSNSVNYTVRDKLARVDGETIQIGKEGTNMVMTWGGVNGAVSYTIEMQGRLSSGDEFRSFDTVSGVTDLRYTFSLAGMQASFQAVRARVCANGQGYIDSSDWSEWSAECSTITKLNPVGDIAVIVSDDSVTLSWVGQDQNLLYRQYLGSYYIQVYKVDYESGSAVKKDQVYEFSVDSTVESVVISDRLRSANPTDPIVAGSYMATVITMPNASAGSYYQQSAAASTSPFEYKTRLSAPSNISVVRQFAADGTNSMQLSFVGSVGAQKYDVTITNSSIATITFSIAQPEDYESDARIVDATLLQQYLGDKTSPSTYNFAIVAVAPAGQETILDSSVAIYSYNDMFRHAAVDADSIEFVQPEGSNTLTVTWDAVPTVVSSTGYSYELYRIEGGMSSSVFTGDATSTTVDLTNVVSPGEYIFKVRCKEISGLYYESAVTTSDTYTYNYYILGTAQFSFAYLSEESRILVSIPHFDDRLKGYAIQFGDGDLSMMTINSSSNTVTYSATFAELPLYIPTEIKVFAGAVSIGEGGVLQKQEYIVAIREITTEFTNTYSVSEPSISITTEGTRRTLNIDMPTGSVEYTQLVEWQIWLGDRPMYKEQIVQADLEYQMTRNLNDLIADGGMLSTGVYTVKATVTSTSQLVSSEKTIVFEVSAELADITGFEKGEDNDYLQWDDVPGAVSYSVSVVYGGAIVDDISFTFGDYIVSSDGVSRDVVRISTVELFKQYGSGGYTFTIVADSGSDYVANSSGTYYWDLVKRLKTPVAEIAKDANGVYANILTSAFAASYRVSVVGIGSGGLNYEVTKERSETAAYQKIYLPNLTAAGHYVINVYAVPASTSDWVESEPKRIEYANIITAAKVDGVAAQRVTASDDITLSWTVPSYTVWSIDSDEVASSQTKTLSVGVRVSTLTGTYYTDAEGQPITIDLGTSGYYTLSRSGGELEAGALDFLNNMLAGTYLICFVALSDGDCILDGIETPIRLAYQSGLGAPTLSLSTDRLLEGNSLTLNITNIDANANGLVDIVVYTISGGDEVNVLTLYAQNVSTGSYTISSEVLDEHGVGDYYAKVRAAQNGIYAASAFSAAKQFAYARYIGTVSGVAVTQEYSAASSTYRLIVTFDASNLLSQDCTYIVKMTTGGYEYDLSVYGTSTRYMLDYSDASVAKNAALQSAWGATATSGLELAFGITANPTDSTHYEAQTTQYTYTVGSVDAPTNITFTQSGQQVVVSWDMDANYASSQYTFTYNIALTYRNNSSLTENSVFSGEVNAIAERSSYRFNLPNDYATTAYLYTITINSVSVASDGAAIATNTTSVVDYWVNTVSTSSTGAVDVSYNPVLDNYTVTITHQTNNGVTFSGQTYDLVIDGYSILSSIIPTAGGTTQVVVDTVATKQKLVSIANKIRQPQYQLIVGYATTTPGETQLTGYRGTEIQGTIALMPIIITQAPQVTVDEDVASAEWVNIQDVTKYGFTIKDATATTTLFGDQNISAGSGSTQYDFADAWDELDDGEYVVIVSVLTDADAKVYAADSAQTSVTVTKITELDTPMPVMVTYSNGKGDFTTSISWNYNNDRHNNPIAKTRFEVTLTSVDTGTVYTLDSSHIVVDDYTTYTYFVLTLSGRDLTQDGYPVIDYDPTRTMPVGAYTLGVRVLKEEGNRFSIDSETGYAATKYQNKYGVAAISTTQQAINVSPECYFTMQNGNMVITSEQQDWLDSYESVYGFNRKYVAVSTLGESINIAPSYRIYINGVDLGMVSRQGSEIDFASLQNNANKLSLSNLWVPGQNAIVVAPAVSDDLSDYYRYIVDGASTYVDYALSDAENMIKATYSIDMYSRYSTPSDPRLTLSYDDLAKHNISRVDLTFANSGAGYQYSVTMRYKDYYDNNAEKLLVLDNAAVASILPGTSTVGLALLDYFVHEGPHQMRFEVEQRGISGADSTYYLPSHTAVSEWMIYTTAVQEFGTAQPSSGREVSVVTEIDYQNQDDTKAYKTNGHLMWTLPVHAYSANIEYTVTLADSSMLRQTQFSATLAVSVTHGGVISYSLQNNTYGLFYMDDQNLYFDMTPYFYNDSSVLTTLRPDSSYYLAGVYYYRISASALDKNGTAVKTRIYDPVSAFGFCDFVFSHINYPLAPSDVEISASGMLTWDYASIVEDRYSDADQVFGIKIITKKVNGDEIETTVIEDVTDREIDISSYLVAGGAYTNVVFVYRVSPDQYFLDSILVQATFAPGYASIHSMPAIYCDWGDNDVLEYGVAPVNGVEYQLRKVVKELSDNSSGAQFVVHVMRVSTAVAATWTETQNYDTIINNSYQYEELYTFAPIDLDINRLLNDVSDLVWQFDLVQQFAQLDATTQLDWIADGRLIAGKYYIKVELKATDHPYYRAANAYARKTIKDMWRVLSADDATLTGEFLTTKDRDGEANAVYSRDWAETDHKEAVLAFEVNGLYGDDAKVHLPQSVTVRVKLWNGQIYLADRIYEYTYSLPDLQDLLQNPNITQITSEEGDVTASRSTTTSGYYRVTIDVHKLFDYTENYAADYAGVYHLEWKINEDSVGCESNARRSDGSLWYLYTRDVCHYTVIQTPILDYRLGLTQKSGQYVWVLNWTLTPNKYTYSVNTDTDYNVNIFAFAQESNGTYGCDSAYASLSAEGKKFFLQNQNKYSSNVVTSYGFAIENYITDLSTDTINDRRCYIGYSTYANMTLQPNVKYKFFIYLTPKTLTGNGDPNVYYYLASETSAPVEYVYKTVSPAYYSATVTAKQEGVYLTEGDTDYSAAKIYDIRAHQNGNGYNNALELYIYDTQDAAAGTNSAWTANQEETGTYLAHYIISTLDNVGTVGQTLPLYVAVDYQPNRLAGLTYLTKADGSLRQIGTLKNTSSGETTVELYDFALDELLGQKADIPITYYCKIKSWLDNDEVNRNAQRDSSGSLTGMTVYGTDWLRKYVTTDETEIARYLANISSLQSHVALLDLNKLNPSYYFTFQHTVKFATPSVSKVEILNNSGYTDVVGSCIVDFSGSSSGVTDGYISSESNSHYYYRIWLNGVYNQDKNVQTDKLVKLSVKALQYNESGNIDFASVPSYDVGSVTLNVQYQGTSCYVELSLNSLESGAAMLFSAIDELLPNKLLFTVQSVMTDQPARSASDGTNVGGANTADSFYSQGATSGTKVTMTRKYATSNVSAAVTAIVKKQYAAPMISYRYDDTTSINLVGSQSTQTISGNESNVLATGNYAGMALNPYLYVSGDNYGVIGAQGGENGYEYQRLTSNTQTYYEVVFVYGGRTSESCLFATSDINATLTRFATAVRQSNLRYNYNSYSDIYPYSQACLYEILYSFVNEGVSAGSYHGGVISARIRVAVPTDPAAAGYWTTSDWREGGKMCFNVRLETVRTAFDASQAEVADTDGQKHLATMYAKENIYYYYQSQIPFQYYTIKKSVKYRVIMTRNNADGTDTVYSYDTLSAASTQYGGASAAEWTPSNTTPGAVNTGDLATILAQDLTTASNNARYNQWLLGGEWQINVLAYADDTLTSQYVTRGFDSCTRTYMPVLQLVNNVENVTVSMTVDTTSGTVGALSPANVTISPLNNAKSSNKAVSYAQFTYNNDTSGDRLASLLIDDQASVADMYRDKKMIVDFLNTCYVNNSAVIGGEYGFLFKFTVGEQSTYADYLLDSDATSRFTFKFYRQVDGSLINVSATATDAGVTFSGSIDRTKVTTVTGMTVALYQTVLNSSTQKSTLTSLTSADSGNTRSFSGSISFNKNKADCFSSTTFSSSEATQLTTAGYVTSDYVGYLQAGTNFFRFIPVQDDTAAQYNLLKKDFYIEKSATYIVPASLGPTVSLTYSTDKDGGGQTKKTGSTPHTCTTCGGDGKVDKVSTATTPNAEDCTACGTTGKLEDTKCPNCSIQTPYAKSGNWVTCSTCGGSTKKTCSNCTNGKVKCTNCPNGYVTTNNGISSPCPKCNTTRQVNCSTCGGTGTVTCTACSGFGNPGYTWQTCTTCGGARYYKPTCTTCGGDGKVDKIEEKTEKNALDCTKCNATGTIYTSYSYWYYYAYYKYITSFQATFGNSSGCTASASYTYGWKHTHSGSCTKTDFSSSGSSSSLSSISSGISLSKANYASITVTISCKSGFANYFAKSSDTATIAPDVSSAHYEAH